MSNCPNKKHPDWITTVNKVGVINAYRLFVNNGYDIPKIGPFKTVEDVDKHLSSFNKLHKRDGRHWITFKSPSAFQNNLDVVAREVERINTMYNGPLLVIDTIPVEDSKTGRKVAHFVDINEQALLDFWEGFKSDDIENNTTINDEGDVMPFDESMYQQRKAWYDDRDTLKDFRKKVEYLKEIFPDVEVIEDTTMDIPGVIDKDGRTIRMNPNLVTRDSVGHEFGHILIDSIGGVDNQLVRRAIDQLVNTSVWRQVEKNYPDLMSKDIDKFHKEVVAQAIGKESAELFENELERSDWLRWLQRFFELIKQKLGIESDAVVELSKKLVSRNWAKDPRTGKEKLDIEFERVEAEKSVSPYEKLRRDAIDTLHRKLTIRTRHGRDEATAKLEQLMTDIKKLDDDPIMALAMFRDFAFEETEKVYKEYQDALSSRARGNQGFTIRKLNKWNNYISGFDVIGEYITIIEDAAFSRENPKEAERIRRVLQGEDNKGLDKLRQTRDRHAVIKEAYKREGKNLVAKFLTRYSNHISAKYKEEFERDYNRLPKEEKQKISKQAYIEEKLGLDAERINKLTENAILIELTKASRDITQVQRWVENLLDSPDRVVSSMVNAMTETMRNSRLEQVSLKDQMVEILRDLEKFQASQKGFFKSYKDFYSFMLEKNEDGEPNGNIIDVYKSDFWKDYSILRKQLEKERFTYITIQKKLYEWRNENAPMSEENREKFLEARDAFVEQMHKDGEINNAERVQIENSYKNPFLFELHEKINEEAANKFATWMRKNTWKYREPVEKYVSKGWHSLVEMAGGDPRMLSVEEQIKIVRENTSDPRLRFFNFIKDNLESTQEHIPYIHQIRDRLPGMVKKGNELLREGSFTEAIKRMSKETFDVMTDETERGEINREITTDDGKPLMFLPVYYTNKLKPEEQSYDLADAYLKYFASAVDYKHKREVLPEMEMARFLVNNREVIRRDDNDNVRVDALRDRELTKAGAASMVALQLNDWFDAIIYGEKEKDQGTFANTKVDKAKFANAINKFTSLNLLGFNVVQGTANVILGSTMQWIEAFGGEHYSPKDYIKAKIFYNKHFGGVIGDVGSRKPTGIITLLNREFDTLNEYTGGKIRRDSKFGQLMSTDTLFFTSHAGEHWMQSKVMLAMLNRLKAKDENGKVIGNMLDQISVKDGKLVVAEEVKNFGDKERREFEGKMKRVLSAMHGEYSEMGRVAMQRGALGRMGYMFRKFVFTGWKRRWGKKRINNITGQYVEGNYKTFARFFSRWINALRKFQFALASTEWKSLTDMEKANVRRTLGEAAFFAAVIILIKSAFEGDDDEISDEGIVAFLAYQAYRFRAEISFFINPMETMKILRSPMASMSLIENTIKLMGQMLDPIWSGDMKFDRYERGNWEGTPKIKKTLINFIPAYKQLYRLKYVEDQISWLKD